MPTFGLLGHPLTHSFSQAYFTKKFEASELDTTHRYLNFDYESIVDFQKKLDEYSDLLGFNVTIPHKENVIALLDELDPTAARIGAVNTVLISAGKMKGYNTDYLGFRDDLQDALQGHPTFPELAGTCVPALILGTGGAAKAVREALLSLNMQPTYVSRKARKDGLLYESLTNRLTDFPLIVNTTPLGMFPNVDSAPDLPYDELTNRHFCYDLVYNPADTRFLKLARKASAGTQNGEGMLWRQAEASWDIWRGRR